MTQASGDPAFPPTSALPTVAKFERRMRRALSLKAAWRRVVDSLPAILQIVVAATGCPPAKRSHSRSFAL